LKCAKKTIRYHLEFGKWAIIFYCEQMTTAMIDRLVRNSHLVIFNGQIWRMRNSLIRQCPNSPPGAGGIRCATLGNS